LAAADKSGCPTNFPLKKKLVCGKIYAARLCRCLSQFLQNALGGAKADGPGAARQTAIKTEELAARVFARALRLQL